MVQRGGMARSSADDRGDATLGGGFALAPEAPALARSANPLALQLCLMRMLDEIDYGLVLLDQQLKVWHINHLARVELTRGQLLHVQDGCLSTRLPGRLVPLQAAMRRAAQGIRSLLDLRPADAAQPGTSVALVPMGHPAECYPDPLPVMAITCRPVLCAQISLHFFAQSYGLTRTEEAVLAALVQGQDVEDIVRERGLAMSTVRSHVKQLRIKTQCNSMREVLNKVSVLPPVVSSVKTF
jgi:DNA-binding CsgD family transcriptional regulator